MLKHSTCQMVQYQVSLVFVLFDYDNKHPKFKATEPTPFSLFCCFLRTRSKNNISCFVHREIQAQEALQNGQLGSGEGIPDLQPGVLASQAMIEKTLTEDPRWQGEKHILNSDGLIQCQVHYKGVNLLFWHQYFVLFLFFLQIPTLF